MFMSSTTPPEPPAGPYPQEQGEASVAVLERTENTGGDAERFSHYAQRDKVEKAYRTGRPIVALCGKLWTPKRDPSKYPVCPKCKEIYQAMKP